MSDTVTPAIPSFGDCVYGTDWDEPTHIIFDTRDGITRAGAMSRVATDYDVDFKDARCETVYAVWLTRQEIWDEGAGERWLDDQGHFDAGQWVPGGPEEIPAEPPADWEPDVESVATFALVKRGSPGSVKCWKVATGL